MDKRKGVSDNSGGAVWEVVVAVLMVLVAAVAFAQQADHGKDKDKNKENQGPRHVIHGKPENRHAIDMLLDESLDDAEVAAEDTISELKGRFKLDKSKPEEEAAIDFIDRHRNAFGLKNPRGELRVLRKEEIKNHTKTKNRTHTLFEQVFNGVPIWNKRLGVTVYEGDITDIGGDYSLTPDINTNPLLTPTEAIEKAIADLNEEAGGKADINGGFKPTAELIIYPTAKTFKLAYLVKISTSKPYGAWNYYVDAKDGSIINSENTIRHIGPVNGSGLLLNGNTVNIGLYGASSGIYLADGTKHMGNIQPGDFKVFVNTTTLDDTATLDRFKINGSISAWDANGSSGTSIATLFYDPNGDGIIDEGGRLTSGVNMLYNFSQVYDFFWNRVNPNLR